MTELNTGREPSSNAESTSSNEESQNSTSTESAYEILMGGQENLSCSSSPAPRTLNDLLLDGRTSFSV